MCSLLKMLTCLFSTHQKTNEYPIKMKLCKKKNRASKYLCFECCSPGPNNASAVEDPPKQHFFFFSLFQIVETTMNTLTSYSRQWT